MMGLPVCKRRRRQSPSCLLPSSDALRSRLQAHWSVRACREARTCACLHDDDPPASWADQPEAAAWCPALCPQPHTAAQTRQSTSLPGVELQGVTSSLLAQAPSGAFGRSLSDRETPRTLFARQQASSAQVRQPITRSRAPLRSGRRAPRHAIPAANSPGRCKRLPEAEVVVGGLAGAPRHAARRRPRLAPAVAAPCRADASGSSWLPPTSC